MEENEYAVKVSMTIYIDAQSKVEARKKISEILNKVDIKCAWDILETQSYDEVVNE